VTPGAGRVVAASSHTLSRSMSRVRTTLRRVPVPLALLLAVTAVLSLSWNLATAPLQGPDEADHVGYIEHLAETGKIPSPSEGKGAYASDEATALGVGFLQMYQNRLARPPWTADAERRFRDYEDTLPDSARETGDGPNSVGKNPPLYYLYEAIGWKAAVGAGFFGKLFVARLLGGLMLLAMVAFTWLAAGEVFARRRLPQTVATGVVALFPMAGFMSGIINTDVMLAAIWTAFLWLALRTARVGLTWQRAAGLAAVTVLSVLTHGRGLALVPALLIALLVAWLTHERTLRSTLRAAASSGVVLLAGLGIYKVVISAGGGGALFGGEANIGSRSAFSIRQLFSGIWQFYFPRLDSMVPRIGPPGFGYRQFYVQQYFGGVFSSFEVYFPYVIYDAVQVAVFVLLLALYTIGAVRFRTVWPHWPKIAIVAGTAICLIFFLHLASYRALANGSASPLIVGRYLLPMTGIVGIAVAAVVAGLPRRAGTVVAAVVLVGMIALSLGALALNVERFYA
jgi:4-amino-4-deoxy-L-arabinose transferase-like glycosyltransferase